MNILYVLLNIYILYMVESILLYYYIDNNTITLLSIKNIIENENSKILGVLWPFVF